jgi:hypothetical protein
MPPKLPGLPNFNDPIDNQEGYNLLMKLLILN